MVRCVSALCPSPQLLACFPSGQLSVRVENRFLSVRASRHRPKACKTTPFPFLLDLYPSRTLFCPLCSRRSNRQTFPSLFSPAQRLRSCLLSHDARTHLARSASSQLVTALAPVLTVRCTARSNPNPAGSSAPESRSFCVASPAHFPLALRLLRGIEDPVAFSDAAFCAERTAKTQMALDGVRHLLDALPMCRCQVRQQTQETPPARCGYQYA